MDLTEKVKDVTGRVLPKDGKIAVAVSGGRDSMCLIDCVLRFSGIDKERIAVVNVEHGIRGEESLRDTELVRKYCAKCGVKFLGYGVNVPELAELSGRSTETEARIARSGIFRELINEGYCAVLTAHNASDRTESLLMHIFRGCGPKGLVGMTEKDGYIVRPLIGCTRAEIDEYNDRYGVPFADDSTNAENVYDRNFLRNEILPLIRSRYAGLDSALARLSESMNNLLSDISGSVTADDNGAFIPSEKLTATSAVSAFAAFGPQTDYTEKHVAAVVSLGRARTGAGVDLPHGYRAEKESDGVRIFVVRDVQPYEAPYAENALLPDGRTVTRIAETQPDLKRGSVIDADKVPCGAVYRNRRAGDKFHQAGGKRKLLSDWLTDKKIPLHSRDGLICLAVGNEILAIVDIAAGESVKIDTNTKTAVRLTAGRITQDE